MPRCRSKSLVVIPTTSLALQAVSTMNRTMAFIVAIAEFAALASLDQSTNLIVAEGLDHLDVQLGGLARQEMINGALSLLQQPR